MISSIPPLFTLRTRIAGSGPEALMRHHTHIADPFHTVESDQRAPRPSPVVNLDPGQLTAREVFDRYHTRIVDPFPTGEQTPKVLPHPGVVQTLQSGEQTPEPAPETQGDPGQLTAQEVFERYHTRINDPVRLTV